MASVPELIIELLPDLFEVGTEAAGDVASGAGIVRKGLGALAKRFLKRRAEQARDLLFEELQRGDRLTIGVGSDDEAISVIYRYMRAAFEGAARVNLRLLAKFIAGNLQVGTLVADEFLAVADSLSTLSRDELIVIGALLQSRRQFPMQNTDQRWVHTLAGLVKRGVPEGVVRSSAARAQRSGLIYMSVTTIDETGAFETSPLLDRLSQTIDFQDALRAEGVSQ